MIDHDRRIVLSIRPEYANAILEGRKTVELRRTRPRVAIPTEALLYSSTPQCALVGACRVDRVEQLSTRTIWNDLKTHAAIEESAFWEYFQGLTAGFVLFLSGVERFDHPISLSRLRRTKSGFTPPQSFCYLSMGQSDELLGLAG